MSSYVPEHFRATPQRVRAVVDANPLATLVTSSLLVVQAPLLCVDPPGVVPATLVGHVAAAGPFAALDGPVEAVAVHRGVQGYVSPSWYAAKQEHGRVVPTWDYEAVHCRGVLHVARDEATVLEVVRLLTEREEAAFERPWSVDDAPRGYLTRMARNIVALRLEVTAVDGIDKLSQNRSADDVRGVVAGLRGRGRDDLADAVTRSAPDG